MLSFTRIKYKDKFLPGFIYLKYHIAKTNDLRCDEIY